MYSLVNLADFLALYEYIYRRHSAGFSYSTLLFSFGRKMKIETLNMEKTLFFSLGSLLMLSMQFYVLKIN